MATTIICRNKFAAFRFFLVAIVFVLTIVDQAGAATAREQIQSSVEKVIAILKDPKLKPEAKKNERIEQLRQVIFPKFDFTEMAKRSLGADWQRRKPEEQQEFD